MKHEHTIGIECRDCDDRWRIVIPLTGNVVEVFATICPCGAIIVGNYNTSKVRDNQVGIRIQNEAISKDEKYLANGNFDFLDLTEDEIQKLPQLSLE